MKREGLIPRSQRYEELRELPLPELRRIACRDGIEADGLARSLIIALIISREFGGTR